MSVLVEMILCCSEYSKLSLLTYYDHVHTIGKLIKLVPGNVNNRGPHFIIEGLSGLTLKVNIKCNRWFQLIKRFYLDVASYNLEVQSGWESGPPKCIFLETHGFVEKDSNYDNNFTSIRMYKCFPITNHEYQGFDFYEWNKMIVLQHQMFPYIGSAPDFIHKQSKETKNHWALKWANWIKREQNTNYYFTEKEESIKSWNNFQNYLHSK